MAPLRIVTPRVARDASLPLVLLLGSLTLAGCAGGDGGGDGDAPAATGQEDRDNRPAEGVQGGRDASRETLVVVEPLSRGAVRDEVVVSARVDTRTSVQVFPKLVGLPITHVAVEEGDAVRAGDVVMRLYDAEVVLSEQTSRSQYEQAGKTIESRQLMLDQESRRVVRAERQYRKAAEDLARLADLGEQGLVTRKEVEDARLLSETAEDDLNLAKFAERDARIALELGRIAAQKAEVEWQWARSNIEHTIVRAPVSGVVAERHCEVGELSSLSQPAFRLVDTANLVLNLRVPQDALGEIEPGQPVDVRAVTDSDGRFEGVVRTVNAVLDQDSGSVRVIVDLISAPGLVPGLFCEARIVTSRRDDALLVSKRAVLYEDDQPVIFAVNDRQAAKIRFLAGVSTTDAVEILSDANGNPVSQDLRIIVVGQENLKDGAPIRIVEEAY